MSSGEPEQVNWLWVHCSAYIYPSFLCPLGELSYLRLTRHGKSLNEEKRKRGKKCHCWIIFRKKCDFHKLSRDSRTVLQMAPPALLACMVLSLESQGVVFTLLVSKAASIPPQFKHTNIPFRGLFQGLLSWPLKSCAVLAHFLGDGLHLGICNSDMHFLISVVLLFLLFLSFFVVSFPKT